MSTFGGLTGGLPHPNDFGGALEARHKEPTGVSDYFLGISRSN